MYKFIIVDDEHLIRKGILKKVENFDLGLECMGEAENGEEAVDLINRVNPHIVLTDMRMPLMDGKMLLKKLQHDYPSIKIIVISGYSDFEYLQEAIAANVVDYMLKPFNREEIYKSFTKAISSIEKELSTNKRIEQVEAEKEMASYTYDINYLYDLITTPQSIYDSEYFKSKKINTLKTSTDFVLLNIYTPEKNSKNIYLDILTYLGSTEDCAVIAGPSKLNICFILCSFNHKSESDMQTSIKKQCVKIYDHLKSLSYSDIYISSSSAISDLNLLNDSYIECLDTLNKRDIKNSENILFSDECKQAPIENDWDKIDTLVFFIESGNLLKVTELLYDFFNSLDKISPLTLLTVKYNFKIIFRSIRNMLKDHHDILREYSFTDDYESILNNNFNYSKIKDAFIEMLSNLTSMFKKENVYPSGELVNNIKKYIEKNYNENITLEKISSLFFLNPSYCSFLFKEKTGENLIDFVNSVRIEKAKELLKTTDYKIYKIAKMLGYDNDKYFFRVFKKQVGITPEKYRTM